MATRFLSLTDYTLINPEHVETIELKAMNEVRFGLIGGEYLRVPLKDILPKARQLFNIDWRPA